MISRNSVLPFLLSVGSASSLLPGAVVGLIDVGGEVDIVTELGSFSSSAMQSLITTRGNLDLAGVLDAEGDFAAGNFSNDTGVLSDKITGATRYGRADGVAAKPSGLRWGFVNGIENWTPDAGLTHFGLITTAAAESNQVTVTVTFSDSSTDSATALAGAGATWIGFHEPGLTITSIQVSDPLGGAFGNYDDVSLVFVPEPSSALLLGLSLGGLALRRRR